MNTFIKAASVVGVALTTIAVTGVTPATADSTGTMTAQFGLDSKGVSRYALFSPTKPLDGTELSGELAESATQMPANSTVRFPSADWTANPADNGQGNSNDTPTHVDAFGPNKFGMTSWFGKAWSYSPDMTACSIDQTILKRDLTNTVMAADGCQVVSGELTDPWTGQKVTYSAKDPKPTVVVAHVVPISFYYARAGFSENGDARLAFMNDPLNLQAVAATSLADRAERAPADSPTGEGVDPTAEDAPVVTNGTALRSGDGVRVPATYKPYGGPGWMPSDPTGRAAYAVRFAVVSLRYGIPVGTKVLDMIDIHVKAYDGQIDFTSWDKAHQPASTAFTTATTTVTSSSAPAPSGSGTDVTETRNDSDDGGSSPAMTFGIIGVVVIAGAVAGRYLLKRRSRPM